MSLGSSLLLSPGLKADNVPDDAQDEGTGIGWHASVVD